VPHDRQDAVTSIFMFHELPPTSAASSSANLPGCRSPPGASVAEAQASEAPIQGCVTREVALDQGYEVVRTETRVVCADRKTRARLTAKCAPCSPRQELKSEGSIDPVNGDCLAISSMV
jgi:hypothetical protein